MENLRKLSNEELSASYELLLGINELIGDSVISLPLSITNALATYEEKIDKEIERREL